MPRDNFSAKVVDRLRMRVAHRCSNPECRVTTVGPGTGDPHAVANIGKAAHIAAAAPGGPRYVALMTSGERSSINNAIWLCSNCATRIDVDPSCYPIELLQEWKQQAEKAAAEEKGKRLPHPDETRNQLVTALTGVPMPLMTNAIPNVHRASEKVLEALDPRFRVETSYRDKTTTYTLHAREEVPFKLRLPVALVQDVQNVLDHGQDAKLPASEIELIGSRLLEQMFSGTDLNEAHLFIETNKQAAVQKIKLIDPATGHLEPFDDFVGHISVGTKSFTFEGQACGGILQASFRMNLGELRTKTTIGLNTMFDAWNGRDIRFLPHFEKLLRLFELIAAGWEIHSELEIEGLSVMRGKATMPRSSKSVESTNTVLQYISIARKIAIHLGATVNFVAKSKVSRDDFQRVLEVIDTIEGRRIYDRSNLNSNATCTIVAQDGASNIRNLAQSDFVTAVIIHADDETPFVIFGQRLQAPRQEIRMEGVRPKIHHPNPLNVKDGESVLVEWEPTDSFRCSLRYLKPEEEQSVALDEALSQDL